MNCDKVQNLLSAYIDGELPGVEMLTVRSHISECGECRTELESILTVKRALGTMRRVSPAHGLADRICAHLDRVVQPSRRRLLSALRDRFVVMPAGVRWATVAVCALGLLLMLRSNSVIVTNSGYTPGAAVMHFGTTIEQGAAKALFADPIRLASASLVSVPEPQGHQWVPAGDAITPPDTVSTASMFFAGYDMKY